METTYPDLFWGYSIIWLLIGAYVLSLGIRLSRIEKKLNEK